MLKTENYVETACWKFQHVLKNCNACWKTMLKFQGVLKNFILGMLKNRIEVRKNPPSRFTVCVEIKWQRSEN